MAPQEMYLGSLSLVENRIKNPIYSGDTGRWSAAFAPPLGVCIKIATRCMYKNRATVPGWGAVV